MSVEFLLTCVEDVTSGADEAAALREAGDALEEAIASRIDDNEPIPVPSRLRAGERLIAVPPDMAAKAAFVLAFCASGLSRLAVAAHLSVNEKVVRRWLDPRHHTAATRLHTALRAFGQELSVVVLDRVGLRTLSRSPSAQTFGRVRHSDGADG